MSKAFLMVALAILFTGVFATPAASHSGGTNAQGCHTNRSTGDYHCHTPKTPPPSRTTYCHVINGESRCGYAQSTCNDLASKYGGYCAKE